MEMGNSIFCAKSSGTWPHAGGHRRTGREVSRFYEVDKEGRRGWGQAQRPEERRDFGTRRASGPFRHETPQTHPAVLLSARPAPPQEKSGAEWLQILYVVRKHWRISVSIRGCADGHGECCDFQHEADL